MSEMTDDMPDYDPEDEERVVGNGWWVTKDRKRVRIEKMDDNHLVNTALMLERNFEGHRYDAIASGEAVLCMLQGEMAIESVEAGIDELIHATDPGDICPAYNEIIEEIFKRESAAKLYESRKPKAKEKAPAKPAAVRRPWMGR